MMIRISGRRGAAAHRECVAARGCDHRFRTRDAWDGSARHRGRVEQAHTGTLFLDEVGDMSMMTQARILRMLEEGCVYPVGGERPTAVDVRVIAATNRDLAAAVAQGDFREDLYYRLNVITIYVPALQARLEDIPLLARAFALGASREHGVRPREFTPAACHALASYPWPGNVRQLRNVVERLTALGHGPVEAAEVHAVLAGPSATADRDPATSGPRERSSSAHS